MSAPAPVKTAALKCSICETSLTGMSDAMKVRDRGAPAGAVRCIGYEGCMIRASRNRRIEIGAQEPGDVR